MKCILLLCMLSLGVSSDAHAREIMRSLDVSGQGVVRHAPDLASVQVTCFAKSDISKTALSQVNAQLNALMKAARGAGVKDTDMHTIASSVQPHYEADNKYGQKQVGFEAQHQLRFDIAPLQLGDVLQALSQTSLERIDAISYGLRDPESFKAQALEKAIINAKAKAQAMAKTLGMSVGKAILVRESGANLGGRVMGGAMTRSYAMKADAVQATPPAGESEIFAQVQVRFELQ